MVQIVDARVAYTAMSGVPGMGRAAAPIDPAQVLRGLEAKCGTRDGTAAQFEWDARMWYGAMISPGSAEIGAFLRRLFTVLFYAGISANTGTEDLPVWQDFNSPWPGAYTGIPVAAALSHGGRVIIQLPMRTSYSNPARDFWNWLIEGGVAEARSAATHAIAERERAILLVGNRVLRLKEQRGKAAGMRGFLKGKFVEENHYGVNVPLGGAGRVNPFSGNQISADGSHGHVYLYFNEKSVGQCGTVMVGCENSAPHAMSQTGVMHDWRAISEDFSPCGTLKWPKMMFGPAPKADAMVVDLQDGWDWLLAVPEFGAESLGHTPNAVQGAYRPMSIEAQLAYALSDVINNDLQISYFNKRTLRAHLATVLERQLLPSADAAKIAIDLALAFGKKNPVLSGNILRYTSGGPLFSISGNAAVGLALGRV